MEWIELRERVLHIVGYITGHGTGPAPWLEDVFERECPQGIEPAQRAWMWECASGLLRNRTQLQWILSQLATKKKPTGWTARALSLGLYQTLKQDEAHVGRAVRETVDWVRSKEGEAPAKFANAILRKAALHRAAWNDMTIDSAEKASVPDWMWKRWIGDWGFKKSESIARAMLTRPEVHVVTAPHGRAQMVQDISNQRLVESVWDSVQKHVSSRPVRMLDLCAAPGGKTIAMAWKGVRVTATDFRPERMEILKSGLIGKFETDESLPECIPYERALAEPRMWDLIWIDAPCSGSGILRRHPEIRWTRRESELTALVEIQRGLIEKSSQHVPPGGLVVYSVCSLFKEEIDVAIPQNLEEIDRWEFFPDTEHAGVGFGDGIMGRLFRRRHLEL